MHLSYGGSNEIVHGSNVQIGDKINELFDANVSLKSFIFDLFCQLAGQEIVSRFQDC